MSERDADPRTHVVRTADGRSLRTFATGTGTDALVVFESGLGMSGAGWGPVQALLDVPSVAYDRAGYGASTPDPAPRTLARLADDLVAVVGSAAPRAVVLVGHSWGGPIVRAATERLVARGHRVDGLVLVDPSDERTDIETGRIARTVFAAQRAGLVPLARARLLAPMVRVTLRGMAEPHLSRTVASSSSVSAARAARSELAHFPHDLAALRSGAPDLGGTPVRVITGTRQSLGERRFRAASNAAHRSTVDALDDSRLVHAHRSGHLVPATEPALIARTVRELLP